MRSGATVQAVSVGEKFRLAETSDDLSRRDWSADLSGSAVGWEAEPEQAETESSPVAVVVEGFDHRHEKREGLNRLAAGSREGFSSEKRRGRSSTGVGPCMSRVPSKPQGSLLAGWGRGLESIAVAI